MGIPIESGGSDVSLEKVPKARPGRSLPRCVAWSRRCRGAAPRPPATSWSSPARATRASTSPTPATSSGPIDSSNVDDLEVAWTLPLKAQSTYGAYASTPVIASGVIYSQDLESNVQAIDLESGEVLWEEAYEDPSHGPNGVVVADGQGLRRHRQRRLRARPGNRRGGLVGAADAPQQREHRHGARLPRRPRLRLDRAGRPSAETYGPAAASASSGRSTRKTGKKVWHFDTVPKDLWGNPKVNSGGGLWYPPSFDGKGSMYFGTGNPAPFPGTPKFPWGIEPTRPQPLHRLDGQARREDRQDGVVLPADARTTSTTGTSRTRRSWSTPAAGSWRSAPASRASSSRSTPRPASRSGNARSANTTATTTTASTRCGANTRSSRPARSSPAPSAA